MDRRALVSKPYSEVFGQPRGGSDELDLKPDQDAVADLRVNQGPQVWPVRERRGRNDRFTFLPGNPETFYGERANEVQAPCAPQGSRDSSQRSGHVSPRIGVGVDLARAQARRTCAQKGREEAPTNIAFNLR